MPTKSFKAFYFLLWPCLVCFSLYLFLKIKITNQSKGYIWVYFYEYNTSYGLFFLESEGERWTGVVGKRIVTFFFCCCVCVTLPWLNWPNERRKTDTTQTQTHTRTYPSTTQCKIICFSHLFCMQGCTKPHTHTHTNEPNYTSVEENQVIFIVHGGHVVVQTPMYALCFLKVAVVVYTKRGRYGSVGVDPFFFLVGERQKSVANTKTHDCSCSSLCWITRLGRSALPAAQQLATYQTVNWGGWRGLRRMSFFGPAWHVLVDHRVRKRWRRFGLILAWIYFCWR